MLLGKWLGTAAGWLKTRRRLLAGAPPSDEVLAQYVHTPPSAQNAIDAVPGWSHSMPPQVGDVVAGKIPGFADYRLLWGLKQFGPIAGRKILELGPLEAMHTWILDQQAPALIHAIEANRLSFLRCLVTKELLDIRQAKFLHGNFVPYLEQTEATYDLIVASGVLYHMSDPVHLLELIARRADALYIWTHYFSDEARHDGSVWRNAFSGEVRTVDCRGASVSLHRRGYHNSWKDDTFCGGLHDRHYWMKKDDIVKVLNVLGYDDVQTGFDQPDHPNGPAFSIFARRTNPR